MSELNDEMPDLSEQEWQEIEEAEPSQWAVMKQVGWF
jgi:hypothetical protein